MLTLCDIAYDSLVQNIITINNKKYITAGACQFHTVWIRDALFCMDTLDSLGFDKILENIVNIYFKNLTIDENGNYYGPKCFDSMNPEWRTVKTSFRHVFGLDRQTDKMESLEPHMYKDTRNSTAIDSNILICMAALLIGKNVNNMKKIYKMLKWYKKDENGLIIQDPFSDFQDSQRREGIVFNSNLLYYECLYRYKKAGYALDKKLGIDLDIMRKNIIKTFYNHEKGIFISQPNKPYICLLDNLVVIKYNFAGMSKSVYKNLKNSHLWLKSPLKTPGFPTYPNDPDTHIQVSFGGLDNYHNDLYWFWLMSFSAWMSFKMKDKNEGIRIYKILEKIAQRDNVVSEIYFPKNDFPIFETYTYSSERPFTMAACHALELCRYIDEI